MKPIQYFTSDECLEHLTERFGSQLDLLDRSQKLELRVLLTYFILGQDQMGQEYSINDAWCETLQNLLCEDTQVLEALEILQKINVSQAESLLEALQAQCRDGNARLKTAVESMTDELVKHGLPTELAKSAAHILTTVDSTRARTPDEQATINRVYQIVTGGNSHE